MRELPHPCVTRFPLDAGRYSLAVWAEAHAVDTAVVVTEGGEHIGSGGVDFLQQDTITEGNSSLYRDVWYPSYVSIDSIGIEDVPWRG